MERPVHTLSFGQKKRVAIAGVLVMEPELIILDEPTAGLDPMGANEILTNLSLKYTLPLSFIFIPFNVKKRVDLPAPFLPRTAVVYIYINR